MAVPTYPVFEFAFKELYQQKEVEIERIKKEMVSMEANQEGFVPVGSRDTTNFFLVELSVVLPECKHFEIEDDVREMLLRTRAPKKPELHLPFDYMYLDVEFKKEDLLRMGFHLDKDVLCGIVVRKGDILYQVEGGRTSEVVGKDLRVSVATIDYQDAGRFLSVTTFPTKIEVKKGYNERIQLEVPKGVSINDQKLIADFVVNFLYFLNNPEVKYQFVERSEKNIQRRLKAGKPVLPSSYKITLTGQTLRYLNEVKAGIRSECKYAFDVRGHYRTLNSPFYKEKRGVRIWVSHFVKGKEKGFLVEKYYNVEDKKDGGI